MITLKSGQWNLHREGVAAVLKAWADALCNSGVIADPYEAEERLFTSANAPGCADVVADYTEATFSGYAPVAIIQGGACDGQLEWGVNTDGIGELIFDQQAWTEGDPATITEVVNGSYLVIILADLTELLLATFVFDSPVSMAAPGDILKVSGFALLDCQIVEEPEA